MNLTVHIKDFLKVLTNSDTISSGKECMEIYFYTSELVIITNESKIQQDIYELQHLYLQDQFQWNLGMLFQLMYSNYQLQQISTNMFDVCG